MPWFVGYLLKQLCVWFAAKPLGKKHVLTQDDFECIVESATAGEVMVLKRDIAQGKDLTDLIGVRFEMMIDANGTQMIVLHGGATQGQAGSDDDSTEQIHDLLSSCR